MFTDYFGQTPRAKLLDFLGDHPTSDYNVTELAAKAGITRQTVYSALEGLLAVKMVRETRRIGQSALYTIDLDHPVTRSVLQADLVAARDSQRAVLVH